MVLLAHVRSAFALSNGTCGSPRMTRELRDQGLAVGRRRTARLMRDNGLSNYINSFYNPVRRHSSLDFISPAAFERLAA
jgi:transposase InsO family protein